MIRYWLAITWCRLTGGHHPIVHRSLADGSVTSVRCTRCPASGPGE